MTLEEAWRYCAQLDAWFNDGAGEPRDEEGDE